MLSPWAHEAQNCFRPKMLEPITRELISRAIKALEHSSRIVEPSLMVDHGVRTEPKDGRNEQSFLKNLDCVDLCR